MIIESSYRRESTRMPGSPTRLDRLDDQLITNFHNDSQFEQVVIQEVLNRGRDGQCHAIWLTLYRTIDLRRKRWQLDETRTSIEAKPRSALRHQFLEFRGSMVRVFQFIVVAQWLAALSDLVMQVLGGDAQASGR